MNEQQGTHSGSKQLYIKPLSGDQKHKLPSEVFDAELEAVQSRRKNYSLTSVKLDASDKREPAVDLGLMGLALSGGGIRSATFCLGVLQALARHDLLNKIDYLSTVSGGGYIGSSLSYFLKLKNAIDPETNKAFGVGKEDFPYGTAEPGPMARRTESENDRKILHGLRSRGNYLTPGKGITLTSGLGVVLRGILTNLLVWLPIAVVFMVSLIHFSSFITKNPIFVPIELFKLPDQLIFAWFIEMGLWISIAFVLFAGLYSIWTYRPTWQPKLRYKLRRCYEKYVRYLLWITGGFVALGFLPFFSAPNALAGITSIVSSLGVSGKIFIETSKSGKKKIMPKLLPIFGSGLLLYGTLIVAYSLAYFHFNFAKLQSSNNLVIFIFIALLVFSIICMFFVNLNYMSLHRFYRDRLMEAFMPEPKPSTELATTATDFQLSEWDKTSHSWADKQLGPYHLINTNIVVFGSDDPVANMRGGSNFVLSTRYCGNNTTGWVRTDCFGENLTLSTAMAISGAAANPHTGVGGEGPARNRLVSLMMNLLNLRLGYWIQNPLITKGRIDSWRTRTTPNHFDALRYELFEWGYSGRGPFVQLSDGGHFENLGLYELIRRRLKVIIVVDASADPEFTFASLHTALARASEDFGVWIDFENGDRLRDMIPKEQESIQRGVYLAERGYATGTIHYPDESERGLLIYIKSTLIEDAPLELLCYARANPQFPDEPTADQFFSEAQFEAYRTLGFIIAKRLIGDEEIGLQRTMSEAFHEQKTDESEKNPQDEQSKP